MPERLQMTFIFPFMYYETYGDDSLIKKYYPNMRRYVDYLKTRADKGILSFGLGDWYDYGDFRAGACGYGNRFLCKRPGGEKGGANSLNRLWKTVLKLWKPCKPRV